MTAIYTITSELHDEKTVGAATQAFLESLNIDYVMQGADFSTFGQHALDLIYVRTGGTEGIFKRLLPQLQTQTQRPLRLLTSGKSNSLAASMEILSYLRQQGLRGEIIHGAADYIRRRVQLLEQAGEALLRLRGCRLGIVGAPSDWLIASDADREAVSRKLGIELTDIAMEELLEDERLKIKDERLCGSSGAEAIYHALKAIVGRHGLQGFTIRCFDLLTAVKNTGCLALAKLNSEGTVAGCEGDVPALLSMTIVKALTGVSGFQANPANINPQTGEMIFAHCTIPLNMVERYELDTHFESGIGVGIRGYMKTGPVTIFKVSGDLQRCFVAEGELVRNEAKPDLCRTQQVIRLNDASQAAYFLTQPIGNHHIVVPGHHAETLKAIMEE
jgi:L-fucose isomerase-like protein